MYTTAVTLEWNLSEDNEWEREEDAWHLDYNDDPNTISTFDILAGGEGEIASLSTIICLEAYGSAWEL